LAKGAVSTVLHRLLNPTSFGGGEKPVATAPFWQTFFVSIRPYRASGSHAGHVGRSIGCGADRGSVRLASRILARRRGDRGELRGRLRQQSGPLHHLTGCPGRGVHELSRGQPPQRTELPGAVLGFDPGDGRVRHLYFPIRTFTGRRGHCGRREHWGLHRGVMVRQPVRLPPRPVQPVRRRPGTRDGLLGLPDELRHAASAEFRRPQYGR
jgi:hypothetical protein